jgi:hypothetical protein
MERTITVTDEEFMTVMLALDVTAVRYEEEAKTNLIWFREQNR